MLRCWFPPEPGTYGRLLPRPEDRETQGPDQSGIHGMHFAGILGKPRPVVV